MTRVPLAAQQRALNRFRQDLYAARLGEFVGDQLPSTPSRTVPMQFGARLLSGAICGAAIGSSNGAMFGGLLAGVAGAACSTPSGLWP